ncbi:Peroxidase 6 [Linum perenne]
MKSTLLPLVIVVVAIPLAHSEQLTFDYYAKTCPKFDTIMKETVTKMQLSNPTTAAAVLRLFFHDCMVDGCDASTLIASTPFHKSERDAELNLDLPGDAFEMMVRAKTALELDCPDVVSCADILSVATRNLVTIVGGPFYPVRLGRKDGMVSDASRVEGNLLRPTMPVSQIIAFFVSRGFTIQEMVTLMGAHTIGFSHCKEFSYRLYNFSKDSATDPSLNPKFADGLKKLCANYTKDPSMSAFNDVMTPGKFDNMYYQNLEKRLGLLSSDEALYMDQRTKPFVELYAKNESAFFKAFAQAMEKVSNYKIKTGKDGEIRHRCDQFNTVKI